MSHDIAHARDLLEQLEHAVATCRELAQQDSANEFNDTGGDEEDTQCEPATDQHQLHAALHEATQRCAQLVEELQEAMHTDGQMTLL